MQTSDIFSFKRFMMLIRQSLKVNSKILATAVAGVAGAVFITILLFQWSGDFHKWTQSSNLTIFGFYFFFIGILYANLAFPAFRSKTKSATYLMLPASTCEKFIFELLTRVVAFIVFMPLLFWIVANFEGTLLHYLKPQLVNYRFSYNQPLAEFSLKLPVKGWGTAFLSSLCFLLFISAFTGAAHFSKSPVIKTLFAFSLIVFGYIIYSLLLFKIFDLKEYRPADDRILFLSTTNGTFIFMTIATLLVGVSLLAVTWFRLKEKEV